MKEFINKLLHSPIEFEKIEKNILTLIVGIFLLTVLLVLTIGFFSILIGSTIVMILGHPVFMFIFYYVIFILTLVFIYGEKLWKK